MTTTFYPRTNILFEKVDSYDSTNSNIDQYHKYNLFEFVYDAPDNSNPPLGRYWTGVSGSSFTSNDLQDRGYSSDYTSALNSLNSIQLRQMGYWHWNPYGYSSTLSSFSGTYDKYIANDGITEGTEHLTFAIYKDSQKLLQYGDSYTLKIKDDNSGEDTIIAYPNGSYWDANGISHGLDFRVTLRGGTGDDSINGYIQDDYLFGDEGDDTITGGLGNDEIYGGIGTDTATFGSSNNVIDLTINSIQNTGEGWDLLSSIENINAGAGDDKITGNSFNNIIDGGAGEDTYIINSTRNNFSITKISPTEFSITDPNGTDTIRNVEYIQFTDSTIRLFNELEALKYIAGNTDLITAFGTNTSAATDHYNNFGKSEGRRLSAFSAADYLAKYSDLASAFGSDETLALKHYIQYGFAEGRTDSSSGSSSGSGSTTTSPAALTDLEAYNYIASHDDLISAFGIDIAAAKSHYTNYGKSEGRPLDNFDEWGYLASNNDLLNHFGSNTTEAIKHFISYGKSEGRSTNIFNANSYLNNYADLKNAFGNDHTLATKHYVENGFIEGRFF